jgi:hypothetical protein
MDWEAEAEEAERQDLPDNSYATFPAELREKGDELSAEVAERVRQLEAEEEKQQSHHGALDLSAANTQAVPSARASAREPKVSQSPPDSSRPPPPQIETQEQRYGPTHTHLSTLARHAARVLLDADDVHVCVCVLICVHAHV